MKKNILMILCLLFTFVLSNLSLVYAPPTTSHLDVQPNLIGVGQTFLICIWVEPSPAAAGTDSGFWEGITVEITYPDGSIDTRSSITTDATGKTSILYTPSMVGQHSIQMFFPGGSGTGGTYTSSSSAVESLMVQEDPVDYDLENLECNFCDECPYQIWIIIIVILIIIIIALIILLVRQRNKLK